MFRTIKISNPQFESDGLRLITVKSPVLKSRVDISVFASDAIAGKSDIPVIILLHGVYGSHWSWSLQGDAHKTLESMIESGMIQPFLLVMPSDGLWGDGSGYVAHHNQNFEEWIGIELPEVIRQVFEEITEQSNFYIGGLSMGGFGAFRIGIKYSGTCKGISAHSSIIHIDHMSKFVEEDWSFWKDQHQLGSVQQMVLRHKNSLPPIRFDCGKSDLLINPNRELHQFFLSQAIPHIYEEFEGDHEWPYWQKHVGRSFDFFNSLENPG